MNQARLVRAFSFAASVPLWMAWEILRFPNIARRSTPSGVGAYMLLGPDPGACLAGKTADDYFAPRIAD